MSYVSFTLSPVRAHAPAHTPPRLLLPPARKSNQHATYRRPRERIIRERWQESEGPRRDSGPLRCATIRDPLCEFLACVRKCLGGILRYCHRIFSRNPLRSCLGPWTHTRVTFIPFFVSRPLNRTPLPLPVPLLTKFGRQAGIVVSDPVADRPSSRSRIELSLSLCAIRAPLWKNLNYPGIFFPPPKFLSIYRKVGIELDAIFG